VPHLSKDRSFYPNFFQIEYILVRFDDKNQNAQLSLRAPEILPVLQEKEHKALEHGYVNPRLIGWLAD
jgi:hypothetical protein